MSYRNANDLELTPPEVGTDSLRSQVEDLGVKLEVFDWIYQKIRHKSVIDELIAPLTGDFNRIRANGEAWVILGRNGLERISDNQEHAVDKLRNHHWTDGNAAKAFEAHIKGPWFIALYAAAKGCEWIQRGFNVLADKAVQVAQEAVDLLRKLVDILAKLASRGVPVVGWAKGAADVVGSIFGGVVPYKKEIETIIHLVEAIIGLQEALKRLLDSAKRFFAGAKTVAGAIKAIPSVDSGNDGVAAIRAFDGGEQEVREAWKHAQAAQNDANKHLKTIKNTKISKD